MRERKKKEEEVQILIDLPEELARELKRQAQAQGLSLEELLQRFIKDSLGAEMAKRIRYH